MCLPTFADDDLSRYFFQLRQRGLFVVAEHYALSRLDDSKLDSNRRIQLVVELSRTLTEHASFAAPQQRDELWQRAQLVIEDELERAPPHAELLRVQRTIVAASRVHGLRWEVSVAPEDRPLRDRFGKLAQTAVTLLKERAIALDAALKSGSRSEGDLPPHELRQLGCGVRVELGEVLRDRAAVEDASGPQRASDLVDAAAAFSQGRTGATDPRIIARAQIGLADCARLQGDFKQARELCTTTDGTEAGLPANLLDAVDACRVRCWLDERKPLEGAEYLLGVRQSRHVLSGELWFVQLEALLALRDAAALRNDATLTQNLQAEAELALQRVAEQAGGSWTRLCQVLWERDRTQRTYGEKLDRMIRAANAEYRGERRQAAATAFEDAIAVAKAEQQTQLAHELSYTRGSILLELEDFSTAATAFQELANQSPPHDRAASAHLLAAYALGRLYDQERTQSRRLAYTEALEVHLQRFESDVTVGDARFMLAQLEEQRLQASKALPLYLAVPPDHARYLAATLGAARCYEALIRRLQTLQRDWSTLHAAAVAELARRVHSWTRGPTAWSEQQGEVALRLSRLYLTGRPADYRAASAALNQLATVQPKSGSDLETAGWRSLKYEAVPLQLVALAGTERSLEARKLLESVSTSDPANLLAIVSGLDRLAQGPESAQFVDLTELLVAAVARLEPQRDQLSIPDQTQFDMARTRAYLITGRTTDSLAVATIVTERFAQDVARLRELAELIGQFDDPAVRIAALSLWERVESLEQQGSTAWLSARAEIVQSLLDTGKTAEAAKRLALAKILYPNPADAAVRQRLEELQRRIDANK